MSEATAHNPEDYKVGKGNILGGVENPYLEKSEWGWAIDGPTVEDDYRMITFKNT